MKANKKKKSTGRDYAMVSLIKGATKAGAHKNRKKHNDKYTCRGIGKICPFCMEGINELCACPKLKGSSCTT